MPDRAGQAARQGALDLLAKVQDGVLLLDAVRDIAALSPADRARAQRLANTLLRWMDRADRMLGPYLRLKPYIPVLNILRLGVVELCVEEAAPHGVIDTLVSIAKSRPETARASGLINAVLRNVARDHAKWPECPLPRLPKKLRAKLTKSYGKVNVAAMEAAHLAGAALDLTLKDPQTNDLAAFAEMQPERLPTGSVRLRMAGQVSALPGYDSGAWWVQDAAAALPAKLLNPTPGERVLDLCAAPGGKTMQLASMGAKVTALDLSEQRMTRLRENLARTKLLADLVVADALTYDAGPFDAILLDAPCSATGTIRRHPDLPIAKAGTDLEPLLTLQAALLDKAVALLRDGGRLVYCTCSLFPEEGEHQIAAARKRHPALSLFPLVLEGLEQDWLVPEGVRLRPDYWADRGGMDGFFIAGLRKSADM